MSAPSHLSPQSAATTHDRNPLRPQSFSTWGTLSVPAGGVPPMAADAVEPRYIPATKSRRTRPRRMGVVYKARK